MIEYLMARLKCGSCGENLKKKFDYCPYCGVPSRSFSSEKDYGFFGRNDSQNNQMNQIKLPFGMNRMVNSLIKQLEREIGEMNFEDNSEINPRGFKIRISTGRPQLNQMAVQEKRPVQPNQITAKEQERRAKLSRVDAKSNVKRLSDRIVYEIDTPGISSKNDVALTTLASGLEVKVYSKDKCFVKFIPLNVEVIRYTIAKDKLFLELKA